MTEAYRSNTEAQEAKYQAALSEHLHLTKQASELVWVYTHRRARKLAGLAASPLVLIGYPLAFLLLVSQPLLTTTPTREHIELGFWTHGLALMLAVAPVLLYWRTYRAALRHENNPPLINERSAQTRPEDTLGIEPRRDGVAPRSSPQ